ncbi:MAG: SufB/SufD family protein [Candidatus Nanopelagicales bacterium]
MSIAVDHAPRVRSREVADHAVPTGREEEWRFCPLDRLKGLHSSVAPLSGSPAVSTEISGGATADFVPMSEDVASAFAPTDIVAARALAGAARVLLVRIPREAAGQVRVVVRGEGGEAALQVVIDAAPFSEGTVILEHEGSAIFSGNVALRVGDGATLTFVSVQDWDRDAVHVGSHQSVLGRDARLRMGHITLGGDVVRLVPTVEYSAPGGDAELLGLYFAEAGQFLEHRVFVDHGVPHCRSSVLYKGALQGDGAHTVWIGDVLVRAEAKGVDTYEVNRNLLLSDGARADSVPNLELETGEIVGAGHASATGRFDDEQLFYLQARGIPERLARVLVVRGFFADVLGRLGVTDVERSVMASVDARLGIDLSGTGLDEDSV